jgi:hypothetical protein
MTGTFTTLPYSASDLLRMAADEEKEANRLLDGAQKQDDAVGNVMRTMAESKMEKAKAARDIAGS